MLPFCHHCAAHHVGTCSEYQAQRIGPSLVYGQSILDMVGMVEQAEVAALERMWSLPAREPR